MATIVKTNSVLNTQIRLDNLRGWQKQLEFLILGPGMQGASEALQEEVANVVRIKYLVTGRGNKGRHRNYAFSLGYKPKFSVDRLILNGKLPPIKFKNGAYDIRLFNNFEEINKKYPHLQYQESGVRANVHRQAYIRLYNQQDGERLKNIRESKARAIESAGKKARIKRIPVNHPAIPGRFFLREGQRFVKLQGKQFVNRYIRNLINTI